jgi:hypothetical protein
VVDFEVWPGLHLPDIDRIGTDRTPHDQVNGYREIALLDPSRECRIPAPYGAGLAQGGLAHLLKLGFLKSKILKNCHYRFETLSRTR